MYALLSPKWRKLRFVERLPFHSQTPLKERRYRPYVRAIGHLPIAGIVVLDCLMKALTDLYDSYAYT